MFVGLLLIPMFALTHRDDGVGNLFPKSAVQGMDFAVRFLALH